jgi:hypothetical protein
MSGFEEGAEIGVRGNPLRVNQFDRAAEQCFLGGVTANEGQRGELLQRA